MRATKKPAHGGKRTPGPGKKIGRPTSATEARTELLPQTRLLPSEAAQLRERATARGLTVGEAIRTALRMDGLID